MVKTPIDSYWFWASINSFSLKILGLIAIIFRSLDVGGHGWWRREQSWQVAKEGRSLPVFFRFKCKRGGEDEDDSVNQSRGWELRTDVMFTSIWFSLAPSQFKGILFSIFSLRLLRPFICSRKTLYIHRDSEHHGQTPYEFIRILSYI